MSPLLIAGGIAAVIAFVSRRRRAAPPGSPPGPGPSPSPSPVPPPRPSTIKFDPANATDPATARALAIQIANWPDPSHPGETYATLEAFNAGGPTEHAALIDFQAAAGITPDGGVGTETNKAFSYFLG